MIPAIQSIAGVPSSDFPLPPLIGLWVGVDAVLVRNRSGTGDSLTDSGTNVILTDAAGAFTADDVPQFCTLSGWTNPGNNGTFPVSAQAGGTQLTMANVNAVTEVNAAGQWQLHGRVSSVTDRINGVTATPASIAQALVADSFTHPSGKVMIGDTGISATQNMAATDAGVFGPLSGNVDSTIIVHGYKINEAVQMGGYYAGVGTTSYARALFNGINSMSSQRATGGSPQNLVVSNAAITDSAIRCWAWCYDNSTALGTLEVFKDSVSLGTGIPVSKLNPTGIQTIRFHSLNTSSHGCIWRGWAIADYRLSAAQQTMVRNYLNAVYA